MESNHRPHAYQACALTIWAMSPCVLRVWSLSFVWASLSIFNVLSYFSINLLLIIILIETEYIIRCNYKVHWKINNESIRVLKLFTSLERRWSSRTFRYGYLVTTSPQSLILPSTAASINSWLTGFGYSQLSWCDGRCVQGPGTYSRQYADLPLLAIPASWRRISAFNPNWDYFFGFCSRSLLRFPLL